jgi:hypothetical protein
MRCAANRLDRLSRIGAHFSPPSPSRQRLSALIGAKGPQPASYGRAEHRGRLKSQVSGMNGWSVVATMRDAAAARDLAGMVSCWPAACTSAISVTSPGPSTPGSGGTDRGALRSDPHGKSHRAARPPCRQRQPRLLSARTSELHPSANNTIRIALTSSWFPLGGIASKRS